MAEKQKRNLIRKLTQYPDAALLAEVVRLQARISRGGGAGALDILRRETRPRGRPRTRESIDRHVNLGLRIGAMFGLLNSCLTRSVVRCVLLNRSGVTARVAFGLNKDGDTLDGHCWVLIDGEDDGSHIASKFHDVKIYPEAESCKTP